MTDKHDKVPRKRKVFGRRRVKEGPITTIIELREDSIVAREIRSPREDSMSLTELVKMIRVESVLRGKS